MSYALQEAMKEYREKAYGVCSVYKNPVDHSTDNGLLFSGTYMRLLDEAEAHEEAEWFGALVAACEGAPGLFNRYPGSITPESWDDVIGATVGMLRSNVSYRIPLYHAQAYKWCFNNVELDKFEFRYWLYRMPGFSCFVKSAALEDPNLFDKLYYAIGAVGSTLTPYGNTSTKCLFYLMNSVVKQEKKSRILRWTVRFWQARMLKKYPGGLSELYSIYFGIQHPFATFAPKHFN